MFPLLLSRSAQRKSKFTILNYYYLTLQDNISCVRIYKEIHAQKLKQCEYDSGFSYYSYYNLQINITTKQSKLVNREFNWYLKKRPEARTISRFAV